MHVSRLTALVVALTLSASIMACASSTPAANNAGRNSSSVASNASGAGGDIGMPDWVMNPPVEDGAWFAVGSGTYKSMSTMQLGMQAAATQARRQLSDSVRVRVEGCTKTYSRQILAADGTISEEQLSQDVTRAVSITILEGAAIVKQDFYAKDDGTNIVYALARITAADVARSLHETLAKYPDIPPYDQVERDLMQGISTDPNQSNLPGANNPPPAANNVGTPGSVVNNSGGPGNNPPRNSGPGMNTGSSGPGMNTPRSGPGMNTGNNNPGGNAGNNQGPAEVDPERARRWTLDRTDPEYPKNLWLLGVGQGTSTAAAEASARADLVAQLSVKIEGVTTIWSSSLVKIKNSDLDVTEVVRSTDTVTSTVNQTIRGSRVAGMARIENNWVVLVVLKIADFLRETGARIDQLEREIADGVNSAKRSSDAGQYLAAIRTLGRVYGNVREVIALIELYNVFGSPARTSAYTLAMIEGMILMAGQNVTLSFRIKATMEFANGSKEESGEGTLTGAITGRLQQARQGITVRAPSDMLMQLKAEEIGSAGRESLRRLLPDTNLLVHGVVKTQFQGRVVDGRFAKPPRERADYHLHLGSHDPQRADRPDHEREQRRWRGQHRHR